MDSRTEVTPSEFRAIADRVELTELLSRYHQFIDAMEWQRLEEVFAPNARCAYTGLEVFGLEDVHLEGREKIIRWLRESLGQFDDRNPKHFFANHVFDIAGNRARTRSYLHGLNPHVGGVYEIDHERLPEGWRIADLHLRHFTTDRSRRARPEKGTGGD